MRAPTKIAHAVRPSGGCSPVSPLEQTERRRQVRGLLVLAIAAILFAIVRAGAHRVFTVGWWRLW